MAPKKQAKGCKNIAWTEKHIKLFSSVLASTERRGKPFVCMLETLALKKSANESVFSNVRGEFEDVLVAEHISAASNDNTFTIEQL